MRRQQRDYRTGIEGTRNNAENNKREQRPVKRGRTQAKITRKTKRTEKQKEKTVKRTEHPRETTEQRTIIRTVKWKKIKI
jgi:hypothetical protein